MIPQTESKTVLPKQRPQIIVMFSDKYSNQTVIKHVITIITCHSAHLLSGRVSQKKG
jgi:hypothetical protein